MNASARRDALNDVRAFVEAYADENMRMAQDTIILDPVLSGRDRSEAGFVRSHSMSIDGCIHSANYHAAQAIIAEIDRLLGIEPT